MSYTIPSLPTEAITWGDIETVIRALGFDPTWLRRLEFGRGYIDVDYMVLNEKGHPMAAGDEVATAKVRIPYRHDRRTEQLSVTVNVTGEPVDITDAVREAMATRHVDAGQRPHGRGSASENLME
jgi:hypothetical protein